MFKFLANLVLHELLTLTKIMKLICHCNPSIDDILANVCCRFKEYLI